MGLQNRVYRKKLCALKFILDSLWYLFLTKFLLSLRASNTCGCPLSHQMLCRKVQNFLALCRDPQPFCPHFAEDLFLLKHPSIKLMAVLGLTEYTDWLEIKKESPAILSSLKDNWKRLIKNRCQESLNSIQKEMESADPSVAAELNSIKGVLETIPNEADKAIDAANNLDEVIKAWPMLLNPSPLDIS
jgi:hypothetical protein